MTNEEFLNRVREQVGDEYTFLEEFKTVWEPLIVCHNKCGNVYRTTPHNFYQAKRRCPDCSRKKHREDRLRSIESVREQVKGLVGDEYIIETFTGTHEYSDVIHKVCGNRYKVTMVNFIRNGSRCPYCRRFGSINELRLLDFCKKLKSDTCKLDRSLNDAKYEIDIYIPSLKIGFDYNGSWYHSIHRGGVQPGYHERKQNYFYNKGIKLIYLWEYEGIEKCKEDIKNCIANGIEETNEEKEILWYNSNKCKVMGYNEIPGDNYYRIEKPNKLKIREK